MSLQGPNLTPPELTSGIDHTDALETWSTWISSLGGSDDHSAPPPPLPDSILPTVTLADFGRYLASIGRKLDSYQGTFKESGVRISSSQSDASPMTTESSSGLAQAMTEVPLLFFREDFDLDSSEVWKHVGAIDSQMKHQEAMDQLSLQLVSLLLQFLIAGNGSKFLDAWAQFLCFLCFGAGVCRCRTRPRHSLHTRLLIVMKAFLRRLSTYKSSMDTWSSCCRPWRRPGVKQN